MQEQAVKQIINNIDNIIFRALKISYNKNVSTPAFTKSEIVEPDQSGVHISTENIDIFISSKKAVLPVTKLDYRIPQTRIYITYLQANDYYVRLIEYFDHTIIFVEYLHGKSLQLFELRSKKTAMVVQYPDEQVITDNAIILQNYGISVIQMSDADIVRFDELSDHIKNCINREIKSHPISIIHTANTELLKELDSSWCLIHSIKKDNTIGIEELIKSGISNLIWIQEIYIQLGWFDLLEKFYHDIANIDLSPQFLKIVTKTLSRFNSVRKLLKLEPVIFKMAGDNVTSDMSGKYLNYLIQWPDNQNADIYDSIQTKWNYLHIPAVRLKFGQCIQENPDEYVALAYLTLQNRFWWYERLKEILIGYLPEEKKNVYNFLDLICKINITSFHKDSIYFSRYSYTDNSNLQIKLNNSIIRKDTFRNQMHFSCLEFVSKFYIRINKNADFEYFPDNNLVKIRPQLQTRYQLDSLECIIRVKDVVLEVPLLWDQMTIEFNKCRFKFLRKKDRFQVTIKFTKFVTKIQINEDIIENNFKSVIKYYIPCQRIRSNQKISVYNVFGAELDIDSVNSEMLVIKGVGCNAFGILNSQFRMHLGFQKKSHFIDLCAPHNKLLNLNRDKLELKLTASKFDPINLQLNTGDPLIIKLLNSSIFELYCKLKICIDEKELNKNEIINLCIENLGFAPQVENITDLLPDKNKIFCIICSLYRDQNLSNETKYKIRPINNKTNQMAIWMNPLYLSSMFSEAFFTSFYR